MLSGARACHGMSRRHSSGGSCLFVRDDTVKTQWTWSGTHFPMGFAVQHKQMQPCLSQANIFIGQCASGSPPESVD